MKDGQAKVLDDLRNLIVAMKDNRVAHSLASRYCPDPWAQSLREVADSFLCAELALQGIQSQLEPFLDHGPIRPRPATWH